MARAYVSIGSNIDRARNIAAALQRLEAAFGPLERSSIFESEAVGFDSAPFYNLVVGFDTSAVPRAVQAVLRRIEADSGRVRTAPLAARSLDLDLLLYDDLVGEADGLVLPRDDITRYAFVLAPLAEIAGARRHPVTGERFAELWARFGDASQAVSRVEWPPAAG